MLLRGGNVFQGYLKDPRRRPRPSSTGWLHTGDIAEIDDDGYVKIVDRKKELIITSGGKNISPANLEAALKTIPGHRPGLRHRRPRHYIAALLVLDPDTAPVLAKELGLEELSLPELAEHPDMRAAVQAGRRWVNARFAQVEQIKKFTLLGEEWLPDSERAHPDLEAEAARRPQPLCRRHRGDVRVALGAGAIRGGRLRRRPPADAPATGTTPRRARRERRTGRPPRTPPPSAGGCGRATRRPTRADGRRRAGPTPTAPAGRR